MTLSIYLAAALLVLWLLLPLMMRPAFRNAGLPPTAAATSVLALLFCGAMVLLGQDSMPLATSGGAAAINAEPDDSGAPPVMLLDLGLAALALSGAAVLAKGLMQGAASGLGLRLRRWMAGTGAYAFHAGTGLVTLLAVMPGNNAPIGQNADTTTMLGQDQAGTVAGALLLSGLGLVLLALVLTLFRRLRAS